MLETHVEATTRTHHGELRIHAHGITFVPSEARRTQRRGALAYGGWTLPWAEIAGIERVTARTAPAGTLRVHYDGAYRFREVTVHAPLREVLAIADAYAALTARPAAA